MTNENANEVVSSDFGINPQIEESLWWDFWRHPDDSNLRLKLVETYLPIVVKIVNKLSIRVQHKIEEEDLLGSGVLGLHDAISNFSRHKKTAFTTFAYKRIKGAILDELRKQDHLTRTQRQHYRGICAAISRLTEKLARPPTDQELADETGLPCDDIAMYIGMGSNAVSLNEEKGVDGLTYLDFLSDDRTVSPLDAADTSISLEVMREAFKLLEERDQQLLYLRHYEELGVKEIAQVFGISEGRVSQLYKQIIIKLRVLMNLKSNDLIDGKERFS